MPAQSNDSADKVFRALSSRPRRRILSMLVRGEGTECCAQEGVCACDFSEKLGLGAPTISHHMKVLAEAGLVASEKRGLWVYYRLLPEGFKPAFAEISELLGNGVDRTAADGCC